MFHLNKPITYLLDGGAATTFIGGIITGQGVAILFGCLASVMAFINHLDQYLKNRKK